MVSDTANTTRMTGAEAIVASLEALGVTDVFGMPGGAILPTYDPLLASTSIRHILSVTSRARATPPKATPWPPVRLAARS